MIKRFSSLFAGHIDLGDMGQHETPANERRYSPEHLATIFEKSEALALTMDGLGYDTLWFAEHHFQHEGYEMHPEHHDVESAPGASDQDLEVWLRFQHHADVASAAPRRGFSRWSII